MATNAAPGNMAYLDDVQDRLQREMDRVFGDGYGVELMESNGNMHIGYLASNGSGFPVGEWTPQQAEAAVEALSKMADGAGHGEADADIWPHLPEPK